jgi:hypothetical protein
MDLLCTWTNLGDMSHGPIMYLDQPGMYHRHTYGQYWTNLGDMSHGPIMYLDQPGMYHRHTYGQYLDQPGMSVDIPG